jgi:hypothetical protein
MFDVTEYKQSGNCHFLAYIPVTLEKLAQLGEGGGVHYYPPVTISTIMFKVVVYAPAERADTLPLFPLPLNLLCV